MDCRFHDYDIAKKSDLIDIKTQIRESGNKADILKTEIQVAEKSRGYVIDQMSSKVDRMNTHLEMIKWDRYMIFGILYLLTILTLTNCHKTTDIKEKLNQIDSLVPRSNSHAAP